MIRITDDTKLIFYPQLGVVEQIIIRRLGIRKLITKNLTDSIIAITWDGIKCEKESVGINFLRSVKSSISLFT